MKIPDSESASKREVYMIGQGMRDGKVGILQR